MGSASISVEVKAANSRLAVLRRKREDDEAALNIGKVRIRDQSPPSSDFGALGNAGSRFAQPADFTSPVKVKDRPRSHAGATSMHFAVSWIKRPASPMVGGKPLAGYGPKAAAAADHGRYIERVDALEPGVFDRSDDKVFGLSPIGQSMQPRVANDACDAILSNISRDPHERYQFWLAAERNERQARSHAIVLDPTKSAAWWAGIDGNSKLPPPFRFHCIMVRHRYEDWLEDASEGKEKFKIKPYVADAEACGRALAAARKMDGFDRKQPPLRFRAGRSGRVQMRIIAELPHELTSAQRGDLVRKYCEYLSSFARDNNGNSVGMMFTAAIHRPDAESDSRNYHVHICCYDRPSRWLHEQECWDFAYETQEQERGKCVTRNPLRQPKIIEVTRTLNAAARAKVKHFNAAIAGKKFIQHLRCKFADLCNVALQNAKAKRRVDPRSYLEMQIPLAAGLHLGSRAAALEATGVPTVRGTYNSRIEWEDLEQRIHLVAKHAKQTNLHRSRRYSDTLSRAQIVDDCAEKTLLTELASERRELIRGVEDDRLELNLYAMQRTMLCSRAQLVVKRCTVLLAKMQQGVKPASKRRVAAVTTRLTEASDHLANVERELERHRPLIISAEADVSARERRIAVIDEQCVALFSDIEAMWVQTMRYLQAQKIEYEAILERTAAARDARTATKPVALVNPINTPKSALAAGPQPALACAQLQSSISIPEPKQHVPYKRERSIQAIVAGLDFSIPQPGSLSAGLAQRVPGLASLRGLSGLPVVLDVERAQGVVSTVSGVDLGVRNLRQSEGPDNAVRRAPDSDRDGPECKAASCEPRLEKPQNHSTSAAPIAKSDADPIAPEHMPPQREDDTRPSTTGEAAPKAATPGEFQSTRSQDVRSDLPAASEPKPAAVTTEGVPDMKAVASPPVLSHANDGKDELDAVLARVLRERLLVRPSARFPALGFDVPELPGADLAFLYQPDFAAYKQQRLREIHNAQQAELDRLLKWLRTKGRDPAELRLVQNQNGRSAEIINAPKVAKLLKAWKKQPEVRQALINELAVREQRRRQKARAKDEARVKKEAQMIAAKRVQDRIEMYGPIQAGRTPHVKKLIRFLITDAAPHKVLAAAEAIRSNKVAAEDVTRQRVELTHAYLRALDGNDIIDQWLARGGRSR